MLSALPSSRLWECLDIAAPTTLGALNRSALNYFCPSDGECGWTFTALTDAQRGSDTLFGATTICDAKVVGDGTVNSLDIAVLMYAQFGEGPYEDIFLPGQTPGRFNPATTFGRDRVVHQCGNGLLPNQYQLQLSTDFCLAGHFPPAPPSPPTPLTPPPSGPADGRRLSDSVGMQQLQPGLQPGLQLASSDSYACLVDPDGQCDGSDSPALTQYLVDMAMATTEMRHMRAVAQRWASLPSGEWSRVHLPGTLLAMELFLVNVAPGDVIANSLESELPPPFNCTSTDCAPFDASSIVVRFQRREELVRRPERERCAFIEKAGRNVLEGGTLGLRQSPPELSCPFDLFVWLPTNPSSRVATPQTNHAGDHRCAGRLGVDVGSTAMDGQTGTIQLEVSCATEWATLSEPVLREGVLCSDVCIYSGNGACQDGGLNSILPQACAYGTDCADCGARVVRSEPEPPTPDLVDEGLELMRERTDEPRGHCSVGSYATYAGAIGAMAASLFLSAGSFASSASGAHGWTLAVGRVLQQVYNLERASVRLPEPYQPKAAFNSSRLYYDTMCFVEGGASSVTPTCIADVSAWVASRSPPPPQTPPPPSPRLALAPSNATISARRNLVSEPTLDIRPLCGFKFYEWFDYDNDPAYRSGGTLCYRIELCVAVLAIQNPPGNIADFCQSSATSEGAFNAVYNYATPRHQVVQVRDKEWRVTHGPVTANTHNYESDVGPGPWVVALLDRIVYDASQAKYVNFGNGFEDVYPCPLHPEARDIQRNLGYNTGWSTSYTCDPATCSSAPEFAAEDYGCFNCDTHARVAYVSVKSTGDISLDRTASFPTTRQRWQTQSYAGCFYLAEALLFEASPPPPPSLTPSLVSPPTHHSAPQCLGWSWRPRFYSSGYRAFGGVGSCDAVGQSLEDLINMLLLCTLILAIMALLHVLYIFRMRRAYARELKEEEEMVNRGRTSTLHTSRRSGGRAPQTRSLATMRLDGMGPIDQVSTTPPPATSRLSDGQAHSDGHDGQALADGGNGLTHMVDTTTILSTIWSHPWQAVTSMGAVDQVSVQISETSPPPSPPASPAGISRAGIKPAGLSKSKESDTEAGNAEGDRRLPYATALIWPNIEVAMPPLCGRKSPLTLLPLPPLPYSPNPTPHPPLTLSAPSPHPQVFVLILFAPLLAGKSTHTLALAYVTRCCVGWSCWLPIIVLAVITYATLRSARVLWRFSGFAASRSYKYAPPPATADETADPLFRLINKVRESLGLALIDRFTGDFAIAPNWEDDVATSLRILRKPCGYWGHHYRRSPLDGAHALYFVWIGSARGQRPTYVLTTVVINLLVQILLNLSPLQAAFQRTWLVQRVAVTTTLALAAVWILCARPTSDRMLSLQECVTYVLNAFAAFYAVAAFHLDGFESERSLSTSDALWLVSIWAVAGFFAYDFVAVPFLNRLSAEGVTCHTVARATLAIPRNACRAVVGTVSILVGKHLTCAAEDPYASHAWRAAFAAAQPTRVEPQLAYPRVSERTGADQAAAGTAEDAADDADEDPGENAASHVASKPDAAQEALDMSANTRWFIAATAQIDGPNSAIEPIREENPRTARWYVRALIATLLGGPLEQPIKHRTARSRVDLRKAAPTSAKKRQQRPHDQRTISSLISAESASPVYVRHSGDGEVTVSI